MATKSITDPIVISIHDINEIANKNNYNENILEKISRRNYELFATVSDKETLKKIVL